MVCGICREPGHNRRTCPLNIFNADIPVEILNERTLRAQPPRRNDILNYRKYVDAYTCVNYDMTITMETEVDHVFEIQLLDCAFDKYMKSLLTTGRILRYERANVVDLANCVENANVTTKVINRTKKGPFTRAKNEFKKYDFDSTKCAGIDSYFYTKAGNRRPRIYKNLSDVNWRNIKKEVVKSYDHIYGNIPNAIAMERNSEVFADYLQDLFLSLHID